MGMTRFDIGHGIGSADPNVRQGPPIFRCSEEAVVIYSHSNPVIGNLSGLWIAETGVPPGGGKGPGCVDICSQMSPYVI